MFAPSVRDDRSGVVVGLAAGPDAEGVAAHRTSLADGFEQVGPGNPVFPELSLLRLAPPCVEEAHREVVVGDRGALAHARGPALQLLTGKVTPC